MELLKKEKKDSIFQWNYWKRCIEEKDLSLDLEISEE